MDNLEARKLVSSAKRIVLKIGTRVLVQRTGRPDLRRMRELVRQVAALRKAGREVILVSSGAIGAGMEALRMKRRPTSVPDLQMAAAVGQSRLMATYDKLFSARRCRVGQLLLTHDDLKHRLRHLNVRNTMMNLLRNDIIPIVNENDVVAVEEIKFGDNDLLASLVAMLVEARALILLTTADGFRAPSVNGKTRRLSLLEGLHEDVLTHATGKGSEFSTGGMSSKLQSAGLVLSNGIPVVIANGRMPEVITRVMKGEDVGTCIIPAQDALSAQLSQRKRWIAFYHKTHGALIVDDGARDAIEHKGRSLLPIGIRDVEGEFEQGAVVNVRALDGTVIARGRADFSSREIRQIKGRKTAEIAAILGSRDYDEVIHRDNMVLLKT